MKDTKSKRIILAADSRVYQEPISWQLNEYGHNVVMAGNYEEVKRALEKTPEIIIAEAMLPTQGIEHQYLRKSSASTGHLAGVALFYQLRAEGVNCPYFLLSSGPINSLEGNKRVLDKAIEDGVSEVINMPITPTELLSKLEERLGYKLQN